MTRGEQVICVSNSVKDYVQKNYPDVPKEKLTVIHRGVDPVMFPYGFKPTPEWLEMWHQQYPQLEGKYVITLPGRITRWKGQLDFIKVIAGLKEKEIPVHGLIVGEPHPKKLEFLEEVKNAISAAGVENNVTLVGHRSDLREVMATSDVVVSCSTDPEAFGRVTLEALAIGKPVAAYAHGGVGEQLSRIFSTGCVQAGNTSEIVDHLINWQKIPPEMDEITEFTLDSMLESINTTYKELLSKNE
jgi:glycosyltransferase involved in cell wall biosynthesis